MDATVANMRLCEAAGVKAVVWDAYEARATSASSTDYFWLGENDPLLDAEGEPLVLATVVSARYRPIEESELPQPHKEQS